MSRAMRPSLFRLMGRSFIDSESGSRPASPRLFGQHSREPANFAGFDNFKFPTINFIERAFCRSARGTEFEPVFLIALLKQAQAGPNNLTGISEISAVDAISYELSLFLREIHVLSGHAGVIVKLATVAK